MALPESAQAMGPSWLLLAVVSVLLVPVILARLRGSFALNQSLGYVLLGVVTAAMLWSLDLLVRCLPTRVAGGPAALRASLWVTNVVVFASWYWRLDAGGPHARQPAPHQRCIPLPPDDTAPATREPMRPWLPASWIICFWRSTPAPPSRPPIPGPLPLGQGADDDPVQHLPRHPGFSRRARSEHPVKVHN